MENKPRVKIEHFRAGGYPLTPRRLARYQRGRGFLVDGVLTKSLPAEKGGLTVASVELQMSLWQRAHRVEHVLAVGNGGDTYTVSAFARCSAQDSFSYKLGRAIAVGRLQKQLQLWGLEDAVIWP